MAGSPVHTASANPAPAVPHAQPQAPAAAGGGGAAAVNPAQCIVRLITAGFPIDEELSRRVPVEYSPRLRRLPVVAHGYEEATRVNLI